MSDLLLTIVAIARLALRRHGEARAQKPKRGATPYLRAALRAARQMASLNTTYPDLLPAALEIIDQVIHDAREAEATLFALGANSSAYLTLLASAEATRLTLLAKARRQAQAVTPKRAAMPQPAPLPAAHPAHSTVAPPAPPPHPQPLRPKPQQLQPKTPAAPHAKPQQLQPKTPAAPKPTQHPHHYRKAPTVKLKVS